MSRRKWLARGLVLLVAGGLAAAGLLYQRWTNPAAVRQQVLEQLGHHFVGVHVSLESARLRLLGGIAVRELRLHRRDDLDRADFAYFPSAVIYHDKEQLLEGRLAVRKIELYRPRLRVVRGRDGRWNLDGILGPVDLDRPLPTIVIQQGTVLVEDRGAEPGTPPLELRNVHLTMVNDPLPTLAIEGTATSDAAGAVRLSARFQRATNETAVHVEADDIPVGPALVQRLASYGPCLAHHARELEGVGRLRGEVHYRPGHAEPWAHDFRFELSQGRFRHARLPLPLEGIEGSLHYANGHVPHARLTARAGRAEVDLTVRDLTPRADPSPDDLDLAGLAGGLELHVKHLPLSPELFARLPADLQEIEQFYQPQGEATVSLSCSSPSPGAWRRHCVIRPEGAKACCEAFPYPLEQITGTIEHDSGTDREEVVRLDLVGRAGDRPVHIKGEVAGSGDLRAVAVDLWGEDVPLDDKVLTALQRYPEYHELARSFHATGRGNFRALLRRPRGQARYDNRYLVHFHHAALRYEGFPYPLEEVSGTLDIHPPAWEFRDFRGTHKGGELRISGRAAPGPDGVRLVMAMRGSNVLLDDEMAAAVEREPELGKTWKAFAPSGRIDFEGRIDLLKGREPDIDLTVHALGCSIRPAFFRYGLEDLRGRVRYAHRWVQLDRLQARHGASRLALGEGLVYLKPGGGAWARLSGVRGAPLVPDAELAEALPPALRRVLAGLGLKDPLNLETELVVDTPAEPGREPVVYWDGSVALSGAALDAGVRLERVSGRAACRGRHNGRQLDGLIGNLLVDEAWVFGQPVRNVHGRVEVTADEPEVLKLPGLRARFFGGEVYGPVRVEFGPTVRYELNLTAAQVKLEELGRHNLGPGSELQGLASARLYLTGRGTDLQDLKGGGTVDVPTGRMYNLPLLLDLLKVLGLRLPDRTAFEEAHAAFTIDGPRVNVSRLDLFGNAVSLRGQGQMKLDGSDIDLDFHAEWARITQLLPPLLDRLPSTISNQLLRIHMEGRVGDVRCTKEAIPILTDPFRKVFRGQKPGAAGGGREPPGGPHLTGGPTPAFRPR